MLPLTDSRVTRGRDFPVWSPSRQASGAQHRISLLRKFPEQFPQLTFKSEELQKQELLGPAIPSIVNGYRYWCTSTSTIEREAKGVGKDPCVPEKIKSSQETKRQEEDAEAMGASPVSGLSRPQPIDICWQNPRVSPGSASYATPAYFCCNLWK